MNDGILGLQSDYRTLSQAPTSTSNQEDHTHHLLGTRSSAQSANMETDVLYMFTSSLLSCRPGGLLSIKAYVQVSKTSVGPSSSCAGHGSKGSRMMSPRYTPMSAHAWRAWLSSSDEMAVLECLEVRLQHKAAHDVKVGQDAHRNEVAALRMAKLAMAVQAKGKHPPITCNGSTTFA